jgi:hypothetical protein
VIREQIDILDEANCQEWEGRSKGDEDDEDDGGDEDKSTSFQHTTLCAKGKTLSFQKLEDSYGSDIAFQQFRVKFNLFLNNFFPAHNITLEDQLRLGKDDQVCFPIT